jgi:flavin-dependent dehydrogenase
MRQAYDVCVFGAGPAGASTALRLADAGLAAIILDRPSRRQPWGGESFTGAIRQPLSTLGLWQGFLAARHVPGHEQRIGWGGAPWSKSSVFQLHGDLWHVNRSRFDADLRQAVRARGIAIQEYSRLDALRRAADEWRVALDQSCQISARYLVDATGRAGALARRLGVRRRTHDRLIAFTALVPRNQNAEFDHAMVIEATSQGWWYAAPVPQGHVLAFFTDSDLAPRDLGRRMRIMSANSTFTEPENGHGWLPVGDACAAHDPLCGWGVHRAMANGILAADAIGRYLMKADASLLAEHLRYCRDQFSSYLAGLARNYSAEQRWPTSPFWQRRTSAASLVA